MMYAREEGCKGWQVTEGRVKARAVPGGGALGRRLGNTTI